MDVIDTVFSELQNPEFLKAYDAWKQNPVTIKVFDLVKPAARHAGLPIVNGENALYYSGMVDASDKIVEFLLDLRGFVERRQKADAAARTRLTATYGVPDRMPKKKDAAP